MNEMIFGWEVERLSPHRVRLCKDGVEIAMKSADLSGDALVKAALDTALATPSLAYENAHVIEVPVAEMAGSGLVPVAKE